MTEFVQSLSFMQWIGVLAALTIFAIPLTALAMRPSCKCAK